MEEADEGTGCSHRIEDILEALSGEISLYKKNGILPPIVLLLVDIDNLERVNRWYGRGVGDEVLRSAAKILRQAIDSEDLLARFGQDEYLILLRDITLKEAKEKASRVISAVKGHEFVPRNINISVSIGIANYFSFAFSADEFIGCVVEALSLAQKEAGTFKVFMEEEDWNEEQ